MAEKRPPQKPEERPKPPTEHQMRMRHAWQDLINDLIEEGRRTGAFDNLPGKGKPLNLNKNHFAADQQLAHALLENNDMTPIWISDRKEIMADIAKVRADIERKWEYHQAEFAAREPGSGRDALTLSWDDAIQKWQSQIVQLNKRIQDFNLKRPSERLEIFKLQLEKELKRVDARRWLR